MIIIPMVVVLNTYVIIALLLLTANVWQVYEELCSRHVTVVDCKPLKIEMETEQEGLPFQ